MGKRVHILLPGFILIVFILGAIGLAIFAPRLFLTAMEHYEIEIRMFEGGITPEVQKRLLQEYQIDLQKTDFVRGYFMHSVMGPNRLRLFFNVIDTEFPNIFLTENWIDSTYIYTPESIEGDPVLTFIGVKDRQGGSGTIYYTAPDKNGIITVCFEGNYS